MNLMSRDFRGISSRHEPLRYSTVPLTTVPLHALCGSLLHFFDGLLAKKDQQLPFTRHVFTVCNDVISDRRLKPVLFMRT